MSDVILFLDMDGVAVDLTGGLQRRLGLENVYDRPENQGVFNISKAMGRTGEEIWGGLDADFWASLQPTAELPLIKAVIRSEIGWENTAVLSSQLEKRGGDCLEGKVAWLNRHLPELPKRQHFFGAKKYLLAHPGAVLLDDWQENTTPFVENGGEAVLLPRPWNSRHAEVNSFDLRAELSEAISRARRVSCRRKGQGGG